MAFHDVRFPEKFSRGALGGPDHMTNVVVTKSKREARNRVLDDPWGEWDIEHLTRPVSEWETLIDFYRAREGRLHLFAFKDHGDFNAVAEPLGTGDGSQQQFFLIKRYSSGGIDVDRRIYLPVVATFTVYLDGAPQGGGFTLNRDTTVPLLQADVTFSVAPAAGVAVTADFEFDAPVRFDVDRGAFRIDTVSATGPRSWAGIRLLERID